MKSLLIVGCLFVSFATQARTSATVVVQYDTSLGPTIYLERFLYAGLDYEIIDSEQVHSGHDVVFHITPDPAREYHLRLPSKRWYFSRLYVSNGDSIVLSHTSHHDTILYDRIGANVAYRYHSAGPQSQWHFYQEMGDRDWPDLVKYVTSYRAKIDSAARQFGQKYPEHSGLLREYQAQGVRWFYEPQFRYFDDYYDSTKEAYDRMSDAFKTFNSIDWTNPLIEENAGILTNQWIDKNMERWLKSGDISGLKDSLAWPRREFELATSLPPRIREVAVLNVLAGLSSIPPTKAVTLGEKWIAKMKELGANSVYITNYNAKLDKYRGKLPGKMAPAFTLPDSAGTMHSLADYRGKTIYLDFWGSWCYPCLQELPHLYTLESKFQQDSSVIFVSISLEGEDQVKDWLKILRKKHLEGVQLVARGQFANPTAPAYDIHAVPTFMLIGPDGTFVNAAAPRPSDPTVEQAIRDALKRTP